MDNFIGRAPRKIGDIPVMMAGNAKAKEYRWSKKDADLIKAKQKELLDAYVEAAKQKRKRKSAKTFAQMQQEAIAEWEEKGSASEDDEEESEPPTPPPKKKRKAKDGKQASRAKK